MGTWMSKNQVLQNIVDFLNQANDVQLAGLYNHLYPLGNSIKPLNPDGEAWEGYMFEIIDNENIILEEVK